MNAYTEHVQMIRDDEAYVFRYVDGWTETYDHLTAAEFAARIMEAAEGLTRTHVDAHEYFDRHQIYVEGYRPSTHEERVQDLASERATWERARALYERGLERFGGEA